MFKYTIKVKVKNGDFHRGASVQIKSEENWDVFKEHKEFLKEHNIMASMERIFGVGNVEECVITEKSQMLALA